MPASFIVRPVQKPNQQLPCPTARLLQIKSQGETMKRHREQKGYVYKASGVWYVRHHDNRVETASWSADKSQRGSGWSRTSTVKLKRAKKPSASWRRSTKA